MRNKNLFEKKLLQISSTLIELKRMTSDSRESVSSFIKKIESTEGVVEDLQSMVEQDNTIS
jgi:hypothetical protein